MNIMTLFHSFSVGINVIGNQARTVDPIINPIINIIIDGDIIICLQHLLDQVFNRPFSSTVLELFSWN